MKWRGAAGLVAWSLSGCVNPAVQQAQQAAAPIEANCKAQLASPQYDFIRAKVAIEDPGQIPIAKLSNMERPSTAERPLIVTWAQLRADCLTQILNLGRSYNLNINPAAAAVLQHAPRVHSLAAELASGQISYGEHNRRYSELAQTADWRAQPSRQNSGGKPTPQWMLWPIT